MRILIIIASLFISSSASFSFPSRKNQEACPSNSINDSSGIFCCPENCGKCGGFGCHELPGGESNCCTSKITNSCSSHDAPCFLTEYDSSGEPESDDSDNDNSSCPSGSVMDGSARYCCPEDCGKCGGYGCHELPGGDVNCCTSKIVNSCSDSNAPCIISETDSDEDQDTDYEESDDDESLCPSDSIMDSAGKYCCPEVCGQCGGSGCHNFPGGEFNCCTSKISSSCDDGKAPCKISDSDVSTPKPSTDNKCSSNGILAELQDFWGCDFEVCCHSSCDVCDTSLECTGPAECCATQIVEQSESSDVDISCRDHEPPCIVPPVNDLCAENPCQNGARCGYRRSNSWDTLSDACQEVLVCACDELEGAYSGEFCELECEEGGSACGKYSNEGIFQYYNDFCCTEDKECVTGTWKYIKETRCMFKYRPTCYEEENPCQNGGSCIYAAMYTYCSCPEGFTGGFCEIAV